MSIEDDILREMNLDELIKDSLPDQILQTSQSQVAFNHRMQMLYTLSSNFILLSDVLQNSYLYFAIEKMGPVAFKVRKRGLYIFLLPMATTHLNLALI